MSFKCVCQRNQQINISQSHNCQRLIKYSSWLIPFTLLSRPHQNVHQVCQTFPRGPSSVKLAFRRRQNRRNDCELQNKIMHIGENNVRCFPPESMMSRLNKWASLHFLHIIMAVSSFNSTILARPEIVYDKKAIR